MKITNKTKNVARGLTGIFAGLLAISIGATSVVETYRSWIDAQLGTVSSGIVTDEVDPNEDTYNFRVKSADEVGGFDLTTSKGVYDYQKAAAIEIASEGIVLMKNDDSLPLAKNSNVTLLGTAAYNVFHGGTMGSMPVQSEKISFVDALTDQGMTVDPTAMAAYENAPGYGESTTQLPWGTTVNSNLSSISSGVFTLNESSPADVGLSNLSQKGGTAIVVPARQGGEQSYYLPGEEGKGNTDINSWDEDHDVLGLSVKEMETIRYAKANYDNVVVIINSDSAMDVPELFEDGGEYEADSVLWAGLPGTYGWVAVAQVLDGTVNPSGHMVDTYAAKASVSAANQNYGIFTFANADLNDALVTGSEKSAWYMPEAEGIYIGYRYYETRYFDAVMGQGNATVAHKGANQDTADPDAASWNYSDEVVASFGYGLSYTTFTETLDSVDVDFDAQTVTATVTIQNTGSVPGKHAVQLYVNTPYTAGGLEKSAIALLGYEKTGMLGQGESETVTITAEFQDFATYDSELAHHNTQGGYVLDEGDYIFSIGNGAHDALNNVLAAKGYTTSDGMDENGDKDKAYKSAKTDFDPDEYRLSSQNTSITNQFDSADLNYYDEDAVTYLSRSDWDGTWPETMSGYTATQSMIDAAASYYVSATDGSQTPSAYTAGSSDTSSITTGAEAQYTLAMMIGADYDDEAWDALLDQITVQEYLDSTKQGRSAIASVGLPATTAVDGPAAWTKSYYITDYTKQYLADEVEVTEEQLVAYPTETVIAGTWNVDLIETLGESFGEEGLWGGGVGWYGPAANTHRTPYAGRNFEYYSEDGFISGKLCEAEVHGAMSKGVICYLKHFFLNDQETNRIGVCTFSNEQAIREVYMRAFEYAFETTGEDDPACNGVMGGFNRLGMTWTGHYSNLWKNVMENEWGFLGNVTTDFGQKANSLMEPRLAYEAGTHMFCTSGSTFSNYLTGADITSDLTLMSNMREAIHRQLYNFANSAAMNGSTSDSKIVTVRVWYENALLAATIISAVVFAGSAAMVALQTFLSKKDKKEAEV